MILLYHKISLHQPMLPMYMGHFDNKNFNKNRYWEAARLKMLTKYINLCLPRDEYAFSNSMKLAIKSNNDGTKSVLGPDAYMVGERVITAALATAAHTMIVKRAALLSLRHIAIGLKIVAAMDTDHAISTT